MTTFLDTCTLICILNPKEKHHHWSRNQLVSHKANGPVVISDIVYSEFSIGMPSQSDVDIAISRLGLSRMPYSDEVLFRAGRAFLDYKRKHNGQKTNVLPDFLIGAFAEIAGAPLITTNAKDFVGYFPGITLVEP